VPSLDHLHPNDPRRLALEVIDVCGIAEPPVDEYAVIDYFQMALLCTPLLAVPGCSALAGAAHRLSGVLIKDNPDEPPLVWANPEMSAGRFRWTVFHEVGHHDIGHEGGRFVDEDRTLRPAMGRPELVPTDYRQVAYQGVLLDTMGVQEPTFEPVSMETFESVRRKQQEREANSYAAELIMPTPFFWPEARGLPLGIVAINDLSQRYGASFEATAIRYAQACPERCAVFAAEPVPDADGGVSGFEVAYSVRGRSAFLHGLRQGSSLPFTGLLAEAWTTGGPARGSVTADLLGLDSRARVVADALKLGHHGRLVAIIWLQSGQLPMLTEGDMR